MMERDRNLWWCGGRERERSGKRYDEIEGEMEGRLGDMNDGKRYKSVVMSWEMEQ